MAHPFNEEYRFGSAGWSEERDIDVAGLFRRIGPQIGYWKDKPMHLDGDAPMITIGGAGSGKQRDLLSFVVCNSPGQRMAVLDPRGELASISRHMHAVHGECAWHWNPIGLCGLPQNCLNPLDILNPSSPTLHADIKFIVEGLIPLSGGGNGRYFELRGREWLENLIKALVEQNGRVSLPALYKVVNLIETDRRRWADMLEAMLKSRFESVRRTAAEMLTKQQDTPKEFGAILGEIYAHMNFLDDPALLDSLGDSDAAFDALCDDGQAWKLFLNVPAEYLSIWSPLVRLFFTVIMICKSRHPESPRVLLVVDEAGQLGRFEALLRAFTYGRGAGIRAWAIFQDVGQIVRNFDSSALQSFLGSAQMRQFFGVRDYETAQLISNMLGDETLSYDDDLQQSAAGKQRREMMRSLLVEGGDPFEAANRIKQARFEETHRSRQRRSLMTPDEVLAMPEDRQILFISGKSLMPVQGWKWPFYSRREMAGMYLANPNHPPIDSVPIATRFGTKRVAIITESVPRRLESFPQYASGSWSYVKGFKP